jgi:hypothetical protein
MDLDDILAELRAERDRLEAAILSLERLGRSGNPARATYPIGRLRAAPTAQTVVTELRICRPAVN